MAKTKLKLTSLILAPIITFGLFILFVILHNAIYALFGVEEAVFFILALLSLPAIPTSIFWVLTQNKLLTIITFIIFAIDWAALADITRGKEPKLVGEYAVLIASLIIIPSLYVISRKLSTKKRRKK